MSNNWNPNPPNHRLNRVGGVKKRTPPVQQRAKDQDVEELATKVKCAEHLIEYYVPRGDKSRCPMCAMQRSYDDVRAELISRTNELKVASAELTKLKVQVELGSAIKSALEILGDEDYAWLKVQMYQYKIDKSVILKPTHGNLEGGKRLKRGEKMPANGFMTLPRHGDPEAHLATSIGGLAMAEYLDEAINRFGSAQGMGLMLKAWWKALPGGQS